MVIRGISCALVLGWASHVYSQSIEDDLSLSFGDEEFVSIATGQREHISKAPAVASVITEEDILRSGATDLDDVLRTVPGLHVSVNGGGWNPLYIIRGIYSEYNPQVLVLINGIPINNVFLGNRGQVWGGMPVQSIDRIEVLRGPGSAVYGADAFAGIINITTKTYKDINGAEAGFRAGTYDTKTGWLAYSNKLQEWELALTLELHETEGQKEIVDLDTQSFFDGILGTSASNAPGPLATGVQAVEARFDISNKYWRFRLGHQGRNNQGTGAGGALALDNEGNSDSKRSNFDVTYSNSDAEKWDFSTQYSYFETSAESDLTLFPAGSVLPIGSDGNIATPGGGLILFPEGVFGNPNVYEKQSRFNVDTFFKGFQQHKLRIGAGFNQAELEAEEDKNFGPGILNGTEGIVDGTLTDVTGSEFIFTRNQSRDVSYAFIQDEWLMAPDWKLTSGVRYDNYSDFGSTVNPRLALVWQSTHALTTKLLYGQAFRAPSFAEQFNINNPIALGNPDLEPEEIDTIELVFDYTSEDGRVRNSLNLFNYETKDIIRFVPDPPPATSLTAQNTAGQDGQGFEWEIRWDVTNKTRLFANYAFQDSEDKLTGSDVANVPGRQFFIGLDQAFSYNWKLNIQAKHIADRKRAPGDIRPAVDDYTRVDSTLRYSKDDSLQIALIAHNLFDEDIREPSLAPGLVVNDLPLAGRRAFLEVRYKW